MIIRNGKSSVILVTGGSGMVGQVVVKDLLKHGYRVISTDLKKPSNATSARVVKADLTIIKQVRRVVEGVDAIVHLAAIPSPNIHPPEVLFKNNIISTFNVLQAASTLGVKRVVIASSLSALGLVYNTHPIELSYFPVDEAHPLLAQDVYGISKELGESMADGFVRRNPNLSITSFRFPYLNASVNIPHAIEHWCKNLDLGAKLFWSYLDVVDAAAVIRLALEQVVSGHEKFFVASPDTFVEEKTLPLLKKYYPGVALDVDKLGGFASPINSSAVARQLMFIPAINWRNQFGKDIIKLK